MKSLRYFYFFLDLGVTFTFSFFLTQKYGHGLFLMISCFHVQKAHWQNRLFCLQYHDIKFLLALVYLDFFPIQLYHNLPLFI
jgi:hypothetical protein